LKGKKLPVVRPGTQARRFTHVSDTVKACIFAWRKNKCNHYSIANKESYSIIELARMFKTKITYLPKREGERFSSALTKMSLNNKILRLNAKIKLKDYIKNFLINNR
jgi:UDP-glucose 4-epimerase